MLGLSDWGTTANRSLQNRSEVEGAMRLYGRGRGLIADYCFLTASAAAVVARTKQRM